jgi:hypothetical protein
LVVGSIVNQRLLAGRQPAAAWLRHDARLSYETLVNTLAALAL